MQTIAEAELREFKKEFDKKKATWRDKIARKVRREGIRATKDEVESRLAVNEDYDKMLGVYNKLKEHADYLKGAVESFYNRRDMLKAYFYDKNKPEIDD